MGKVWYSSTGMEENNNLQQPTSININGALSWLMSSIRRSSSNIQQYFLNRSINTTIDHDVDEEEFHSPNDLSPPSNLPPPPPAALPPSPPSSPPPPPSPPLQSSWYFLDVFMDHEMHLKSSSSSSSSSSSLTERAPPLLPPKPKYLIKTPPSPLSPSPSPTPSSSRSRSNQESKGSPPWRPLKPLKWTKSTSMDQNSLSYSPKQPSKKQTDHSSNLQTSQFLNKKPPSPPLHPVFIILRQQELGKNILVLAIPMIIGLYSFYRPPETPPLFRLAAMFLSIGVILIWNGILLRRTCNYSHLIELVGIVFMFSAFFIFVSCFLPNWFILVPAICWFLAMVPFFVACCCRGRSAQVGSDETESSSYPEV